MNRLVKLAAAAALLAAGAAWAAPAANEADAKAAEAARSAHFKDLGKAWEPIASMLRRKQPYDAAIVDKQSAQVAALSKKIPSFFEVDTHAFKDLKTEARDGIWTNQADFNTKADDLARALQALNEAAKGGADAAAFTKSASAVGKTCSACHDSYRDKKAD
jgi:cytochrome c556